MRGLRVLTPELHCQAVAYAAALRRFRAAEARRLLTTPPPNKA